MRGPGTGMVRLYTILCALEKWVIYYACFRSNEFPEELCRLRFRKFLCQVEHDVRRMCDDDRLELIGLARISSAAWASDEATLFKVFRYSAK